MKKVMKRRLCTVGAAALAAAVACTMCMRVTPFGADEGREYVSQFRTEASSAADALKRGNDLTQRIVEEGIVLLKNKENALPMKTGTKVTVFGKNSVNPYYVGGGSASGADGSGLGGVKYYNLYDSLVNAGFEYNPTLKAFYDNNSLSGGGRDGGAGTGQVATRTGETPVASYRDTEKSSFAQYNDAAIVVLSRWGGEGADLYTNYTPEQVSANKIPGRTNLNTNGDAASGDHYLELDDNEKDMIALAKENFDKVIVVLNMATTMELDGLNKDDGISSILWIGYPGGSGINALGKVLNGEVCPSGKTVDTYTVDFKKDPTFANFANNYISQYKNSSGKGTGINYVEYDEGIYVGYRYYETRGFVEKQDDATSTWYEDNVVYPFGYGLSYTSFKWDVKFVTSALDMNGKVEVDVTVTNTGDVAGKEVVQLYYSAPYTPGEIEKSHVSLGAFEKTGLLQPGMSETLRLAMDVRDMASYDYNDANANGIKGYELDDGEYTFYVGENSHCWANEDVAKATLELGEEVYYEKDAKTGTKIENRFEHMSAYFDANAEGDTFTGRSSVMSRTDFEGTFPQPPTDLQATLSAAEIEAASIADGKPDAAYDQGQPWYTDKMPTQADVRETRIKASQLVGLKYEDRRWDAFMNQLTGEDLANLVKTGFFITYEMKDVDVPISITPDGPTGFVQGSGNNWVGNTCLYASPVVVAATWNKELALKMGEAVGEEGVWGGEGKSASSKGVRGGYNGWYAPGNNIHRSPFSGRNFEYYSEDPVLAGKMCANVVKGAQSKGVFVMLKHFALNDQEQNRTNLSTWADEQTMREIYLKAFEISVKEGGATGMMSAFNRMGTHWSGTSYALLTQVLREEWGFRGLVITDWANAYMSPNKMIRAGNDLWLGGSGFAAKADVDASGDATHMTALRNAAKNVLYTVVNSNAMNRLGSSYPVEIYGTADAYSKDLGTVAKGGDVSFNAKSNVYKSYKYVLTDAPKGVTIDQNTGVISGTVANDAIEGDYKMHVSLRDDKGFIGQGITLNLKVGDGALTYTGAKTSTVAVGMFARIDVSAKSEGASATYAIKEGSALPAGMALSSEGCVVGIPETKGTSTFTVVATAGAKTLETEVTVTVGDPTTLAYSGKALDKATVGTAYSADLATATGADGVVYTAVGLPDGMTLSADGKLSGTPVEKGNYTVKVAAWAQGCKEASTAEFTIVVEDSETPGPGPGPGPGPDDPPPSSGNKGDADDNTTVIVVCSVIGGVVLIGGAVAAVLLIRKKKKSK